MVDTTIMSVGGLGQTSISETLEDQYATLRSKCIEQYGEDFCNAVMPRNMVYALTRRDEGYVLPWWIWMIAGYLVARVIK